MSQQRLEQRQVLRSQRLDQDPLQSEEDPLKSDGEIYCTSAESNIQASIYRLVDGDLCTTECELQDLSATGARLRASQQVCVGEAVGLRIVAPRGGIDHTSAGVICGVHEHEDEDWTLEGSFASELPEEVLQELVTAGLLERRESDRQKLQVDARILCPERFDAAVDVHIENYSQGGFCMYTPEPLELGDEIVLELVHPDGSVAQLDAEVRWQDTCVIGFVVGCRYRNLEEAASLRDHFPANLAAGGRQAAAKKKKTIATYWLWFVVMVAGLCAIIRWL